MYDMPTGDRTSTITRILVICAVAVAAAAALVVLVNCAGPGRDASGRGSSAADSAGDGAIGGSGQAPNPNAAPDGGGANGGSTDPSGGAGGGSDGGGESDGGDGGGLEPDGGGLEPDGGGLEPGDGGGPDAPQVEEVTPAAEVCLSYDPAILEVENLGESGWRMRSGGHLMAMFDTYADAADMVKVARNYTKSCFIGRSNQLPNRYKYIIRYWKDPSGLPPGPAPTFDCVLYNPSTLTIKDQGEQGWRLYSGAKPLLLLASEADAARAKLVASENMRLCFIGRDNDRPNPYLYIHEYWRQ